MKKTVRLFCLTAAAVLLMTAAAGAEGWKFNDEIHFELPDGFYYTGMTENGSYEFAGPNMKVRIYRLNSVRWVEPRQRMGSATEAGVSEQLIRRNGIDFYVQRNNADYTSPFQAVFFNSSGAQYTIDVDSYAASDRTVNDMVSNLVDSIRISQPHVHTLIWTERKEPSCDQAGNEEYWTCSECGKMFSDAAGRNEISAVPVLPATGHTLIHHDKVVSADLSAGIREHWECKTCSRLFADPEGRTEIRDRSWLIIPVSTEKVAEFVSRCYTLILNRSADEGGMKNWIGQLLNRAATASQIISGFMNSTEYREQQNSNEKTVEILYNTMLGRPSDPEGKSGWVEVLEKSGGNNNEIINGFSGSQEFIGICQDYGITPGVVPAGTPRTGIEGFVDRCYREALGRAGEEAGLNYWCSILRTRQMTPKRVADGFVFSQEMDAARKLTEDPDALLDALYRLYLGREADPEGKAHWKTRIANGLSLEELNDGFAYSAEFAGIVAGYGLE